MPPSSMALFASPWNCIYSAARLKQDPNFPVKNVMGTGPFKFVEHVPGRTGSASGLPTTSARTGPIWTASGPSPRRASQPRMLSAANRSWRSFAASPQASAIASWPCSAPRPRWKRAPGCCTWTSASTPRASPSMTYGCGAPCPLPSTAGAAPRRSARSRT